MDYLPRVCLAATLVALSTGSGTAGANPAERTFSLHVSEVAIEGDHMKDLDSFFAKLGYRVNGKSQVTGWTKLNEVLNKETTSRRARKAVYLEHGWTHILDPEMVILTSEKVLAQESQLLHARIVVWLSEGASDSYGFWVYEKGHQLRAVLTVDASVEGKGRRLAAEGKTKWKEAGEEEILALAERLGPGFEALGEKVRFRIYDLDES